MVNMGLLLKAEMNLYKETSGELMDCCVLPHLATLWVNLAWKRITAF